ncbi:MAG: superoxide dismutase family protein [Ignavibacteriales bacterium]|nr:MAG: superoxide dismutase family protein [Ignavibacteriales bacterium]
MKENRILFSFLFIIIVFAGCQDQTERSMHSTDDNTMHNENRDVDFTRAVCVLHPTEGNEVKGLITFTKEGENIKVVAHIQNLPPGSHGFHIHEFGDCSAPDAASAGSHFNPANTQHGARTDSTRHAGDFGNIEADENGNAHLEFTDSFIAFTGNNSIIGKGVIVHEKADDFKTQPTGDAGGRLACGVIGISK